MIMKKIIYILFFFFTFQAAFAQDEQPGGSKLREKMIEYIQTKLGLSRTEAEKFQPVFLDYLKERRRFIQESKGKPALEVQQKMVELKVRYRDQLKPIIGEKRSNEVFDKEIEFIKGVKQEYLDRIEQKNERRANKGKNTELLSN